MVMAKVPPMTMRIDGGLTKLSGEPPRTIAETTIAKPQTIPTTVATSIDARAFPT